MNISHLPLEKSTNSNMQSEKDVSDLNQKNGPAPQKPRPGIFRRFANYLKSFWEIEEEEYIDAHGFVSKRPKKKIPLRNKETSDRNNVQVEGANGLNYATQEDYELTNGKQAYGIRELDLVFDFGFGLSFLSLLLFFFDTTFL